MHAAMTRHARIVLIAILLAPLALSSADAQFGTIFGSPPPRPPSDVPGGPPADERLPPRPLPPQSQPPPGGRPPTVRSEPLGPPPGSPAVPLDTRPQQSGPPPSQRPRGTPQP